MSISDEINSAKSIIGRVERMGEAGLVKAETALSHPEAAELLDWVAKLVNIGPLDGTIAGVTGVVKAIVALFPPQPPAPAAA